MQKVSIAMCTYNGAKYVLEQLESFERQTRLPDEIIICDDVSKDNTVQLIQEYAAKSALPIKLHPNETNLGMVGNFNRAVGLTTGDIIVLSDFDDVWYPQKIQRFVEEFERQSQAILILSNVNLVDENLRSLEQTLWDFLGFDLAAQAEMQRSEGFEFTLRHGSNMFYGTSMAFRCELKQIAWPFSVNMNHDQWLGFLAAAQGGVRLISEPLNDYRQHAKQFTGQKQPGMTTFFQKISQSFQRSQNVFFFRNVLQEHQQLRDRLLTHSDHLKPEVLEVLNAKIAYLEARLKMRQRFIALRLPLVLRELTNGHYARFSRGWKSMVADLLL